MKDWNQRIELTEDIKPYYWEFQEEMEALKESQNKIKEVEELSKKLAKAREEAEELYKKWKKVVDAQVNKQFII